MPLSNLRRVSHGDIWKHDGGTATSHWIEILHGAWGLRGSNAQTVEFVESTVLYSICFRLALRVDSAGQARTPSMSTLYTSKPDHQIASRRSARSGLAPRNPSFGASFPVPPVSDPPSHACSPLHLQSLHLQTPPSSTASCTTCLCLPMAVEARDTRANAAICMSAYLVT
jgi:hypothetical protein